MKNLDEEKVYSRLERELKVEITSEHTARGKHKQIFLETSQKGSSVVNEEGLQAEKYRRKEKKMSSTSEKISGINKYQYFFCFLVPYLADIRENTF
jgi:hypothetical protein